MLEKIKLSQFGGRNTVLDSSNAGVSECRECKNFMLRPLGALSVPAAWRAFQPGGVALNLGYPTRIDFSIDVSAGAKLYLQSPSGAWWDVTPRVDGQPENMEVSWAGATIGADQVIAATEIMAVKHTSSLYWRLMGDSQMLGWSVERMGFVPYIGTTYSTTRAFLSGFGPVFTDGDGRKWRWQADNNVGLVCFETS